MQMNTIRKFYGVIVVIAVLNLATALGASASESIFSLDSFYQTINNLDFGNDASTVQAVSVSQTSPSAIVPSKRSAAKKTMMVVATAYSSSVDETDDTPFITAKGTYVRDGIIAANFLPFGTAVKIPAIYGDKVFMVEDRMNKRFPDRIDVWMPSKQAAFLFGKKKVVIEIIS